MSDGHHRGLTTLPGSAYIINLNPVPPGRKSGPPGLLVTVCRLSNRCALERGRIATGGRGALACCHGSEAGERKPEAAPLPLVVCQEILTGMGVAVAFP